jgi:hypothetical protein
MRMRSVAMAAVLFLGLGGWLTPSVTAAPLTVSLSNGITTTTCADGAACDTSPLTGVVSFTSPVGTTTLSLTGVGSGSPALPGLMMDLAYNVTQTIAGTGGTMVIQASETDQTANAAVFHAVLGGTQLAGTTAFSIFDSATNTLFAQTASICSAGPATTAGAVALSCDGGPLTGAAFSLTETVTLQIPAGAYSGSGDLLLTARQQVPAPSALLLLGLGLTVAGVLRARVRL